MDSVVNGYIKFYISHEEEDVNDLPDVKIFSGLSNATSLKLHFGCHPDLKGKTHSQFYETNYTQIHFLIDIFLVAPVRCTSKY